MEKYKTEFKLKVVKSFLAVDTLRNGARPGDRIAYKVDAAGLIDGQGGYQRHGHPCAFGLLAFSDRQTFSRINAADPFVIDVEKLWAQNVVNHAAAPAPADVPFLTSIIFKVDGLLQNMTCTVYGAGGRSPRQQLSQLADDWRHSRYR